MTKVWFVREGSDPTQGEPQYDLPLEQCIGPPVIRRARAGAAILNSSEMGRSATVSEKKLEWFRSSRNRSKGSGGEGMMPTGPLSAKFSPPAC